MAFSRERPSTSGKLWKWTRTVRQPRWTMRQAATGESMPPDMSVTVLPLAPTGSPPGPGSSRT